MAVNNIISYFNDCYRNDNRSLVISNIFAKKLDNLLFIEGKEQLVTGDYPYIPVDPDYAKIVIDQLKTYKKELKFFYSSLMIIGLNGNKEKLCAPLLYLSASIKKKNDHFYIQLNDTGFKFNLPVLKDIFEESDMENKSFSDVVDELGNSKTVDEVCFSISKLFNNIDTIPMLEFPALIDQKKVKSALHLNKLKAQKGYKLYPSSCSFIIRESSECLGVLSELSELAASKSFSGVITSLFTNENAVKSGSSKKGRVPVVLSNAQKSVIENASTEKVSVVIGPPGTGKSFTIAALAIEYMSKGNSVLITSKTDKAVDVIAEKIETEVNIDNVLVRAGRKEYLKQIKEFLNNLLYGISSNDKKPIDVSKKDKEIKALEKKILKLEKNFRRLIKYEHNRSNNILNGTNNKGLIQLFYEYFGSNLSITKISSLINHYYDKLHSGVVEYIKLVSDEQRYNILQKSRSKLTLFLDAIKARSSSRKEKLFSDLDFDVILKTFPIWLVKMSDMYNILPMRKEMFDVVIIDEATQCDIASCIPVFQRAKKVVIVGDPKQLRHVSFLSNVIQNNLFNKHKLNSYGWIKQSIFNYRKNSILDYAVNSIKRQEQVSFLNEHFRSLPAIVRFSNENFYDNKLSIMTERPDLSGYEGITFIRCEGNCNSDGVNDIEFGIICNYIDELVKSEEFINEKEASSIGILSPFRNQANYMSENIGKRFSTDVLEKHAVKIGTAYEFQGDERDCMYLSFAIDSNSHPMSFFHAGKADVLNVSLTRARSKQTVVHSFNNTSIKKNTLLRSFFDFYKKDVTFSHIINIDKEKFLNEVTDMLKAMDIKICISYPIAGILIDVLAYRDDKYLGIDLIGYPGDFEDSYDLERYKVLKRAGITIYPLFYSDWTKDKEEFKKDFIAMFN